MVAVVEVEVPDENYENLVSKIKRAHSRWLKLPGERDITDFAITAKYQFSSEEYVIVLDMINKGILKGKNNVISKSNKVVTTYNSILKKNIYKYESLLDLITKAGEQDIYVESTRLEIQKPVKGTIIYCPFVEEIMDGVISTQNNLNILFWDYIDSFSKLCNRDIYKYLKINIEYDEGIFYVRVTPGKLKGSKILWFFPMDTDPISERKNFWLYKFLLYFGAKKVEIIQDEDKLDVNLEQKIVSTKFNSRLLNGLNGFPTLISYKFKILYRQNDKEHLKFININKANDYNSFQGEDLSDYINVSISDILNERV